MKSCPFCDHSALDIVKVNEHALTIYDRYPVNTGHTLIIPKRHVANFFDTTLDERKSMNELLEECKLFLDEKHQPDGYNIGINCNEAAGQTVFHIHMHLIPRYKGDLEDPRGGVRGVIPEKRIY